MSLTPTGNFGASGNFLNAQSPKLKPQAHPFTPNFPLNTPFFRGAYPLEDLADSGFEERKSQLLNSKFKLQHNAIQINKSYRNPNPPSNIEITLTPINVCQDLEKTLNTYGLFPTDIVGIGGLSRRIILNYPEDTPPLPDMDICFYFNEDAQPQFTMIFESLIDYLTWEINKKYCNKSAVSREDVKKVGGFITAMVLIDDPQNGNRFSIFKLGSSLDIKFIYKMRRHNVTKADGLQVYINQPLVRLIDVCKIGSKEDLINAVDLLRNRNCVVTKASEVREIQYRLLVSMRDGQNISEDELNTATMQLMHDELNIERSPSSDRAFDSYFRHQKNHYKNPISDVERSNDRLYHGNCTDFWNMLSLFDRISDQALYFKSVKMFAFNWLKKRPVKVFTNLANLIQEDPGLVFHLRNVLQGALLYSSFSKDSKIIAYPRFGSDLSSIHHYFGINGPAGTYYLTINQKNVLRLIEDYIHSTSHLTEKSSLKNLDFRELFQDLFSDSGNFFLMPLKKQVIAFCDSIERGFLKDLLQTQFKITTTAKLFIDTLIKDSALLNSYPWLLNEYHYYNLHQLLQNPLISNNINLKNFIIKALTVRRLNPSDPIAKELNDYNDAIHACKEEDFKTLHLVTGDLFIHHAESLASEIIHSLNPDNIIALNPLMSSLKDLFPPLHQSFSRILIEGLFLLKETYELGAKDTLYQSIFDMLILSAELKPLNDTLTPFSEKTPLIKMLKWVLNQSNLAKVKPLLLNPLLLQILNLKPLHKLTRKDLTDFQLNDCLTLYIYHVLLQKNEVSLKAIAKTLELGKKNIDYDFTALFNPSFLNQNEITDAQDQFVYFIHLIKLSNYITDINFRKKTLLSLVKQWIEISPDKSFNALAELLSQNPTDAPFILDLLAGSLTCSLIDKNIKISTTLVLRTGTVQALRPEPFLSNTSTPHELLPADKKDAPAINQFIIESQNKTLVIAHNTTSVLDTLFNHYQALRHLLSFQKLTTNTLFKGISDIILDHELIFKKHLDYIKKLVELKQEIQNDKEFLRLPQENPHDHFKLAANECTYLISLKKINSTTLTSFFQTGIKMIDSSLLNESEVFDHYIKMLEISSLFQKTENSEDVTRFSLHLIRLGHQKSIFSSNHAKENEVINLISFLSSWLTFALSSEIKFKNGAEVISQVLRDLINRASLCPFNDSPFFLSAIYNCLDSYFKYAAAHFINEHSSTLEMAILSIEKIHYPIDSSYPNIKKLISLTDGQTSLKSKLLSMIGFSSFDSKIKHDSFAPLLIAFIELLKAPIKENKTWNNEIELLEQMIQTSPREYRGYLSRLITHLKDSSQTGRDRLTHCLATLSIISPIEVSKLLEALQTSYPGIKNINLDPLVEHLIKVLINSSDHDLYKRASVIWLNESNKNPSTNLVKLNLTCLIDRTETLLSIIHKILEIGAEFPFKLIENVIDFLYHLKPHNQAPENLSLIPFYLETLIHRLIDRSDTKAFEYLEQILFLNDIDNSLDLAFTNLLSQTVAEALFTKFVSLYSKNQNIITHSKSDIQNIKHKIEKLISAIPSLISSTHLVLKLYEDLLQTKEIARIEQIFINLRALSPTQPSKKRLDDPTMILEIDQETKIHELSLYAIQKIVQSKPKDKSTTDAIPLITTLLHISKNSFFTNSTNVQKFKDISLNISSILHSNPPLEEEFPIINAFFEYALGLFDLYFENISKEETSFTLEFINNMSSLKIPSITTKIWVLISAIVSKENHSLLSVSLEKTFCNIIQITLEIDVKEIFDKVIHFYIHSKIEDRIVFSKFLSHVGSSIDYHRILGYYPFIAKKSEKLAHYNKSVNEKQQLIDYNNLLSYLIDIASLTCHEKKNEADLDNSPSIDQLLDLILFHWNSSKEYFLKQNNLDLFKMHFINCLELEAKTLKKIIVSSMSKDFLHIHNRSNQNGKLILLNFYFESISESALKAHSQSLIDLCSSLASCRENQYTINDYIHIFRAVEYMMSNDIQEAPFENAKLIFIKLLDLLKKSFAPTISNINAKFLRSPPKAKTKIQNTFEKVVLSAIDIHEETGQVSANFPGHFFYNPATISNEALHNLVLKHLTPSNDLVEPTSSLIMTTNTSYDTSPTHLSSETRRADITADHLPQELAESIRSIFCKILAKRGPVGTIYYLLLVPYIAEFMNGSNFTACKKAMLKAHIESLDNFKITNEDDFKKVLTELKHHLKYYYWFNSDQGAKIIHSIGELMMKLYPSSVFDFFDNIYIPVQNAPIDFYTSFKSQEISKSSLLKITSTHTLIVNPKRLREKFEFDLELFDFILNECKKGNRTYARLLFCQAGSLAKAAHNIDLLLSNEDKLILVEKLRIATIQICHLNPKLIKEMYNILGLCFSNKALSLPNALNSDNSHLFFGSIDKELDVDEALLSNLFDQSYNTDFDRIVNILIWYHTHLESLSSQDFVRILAIYSNAFNYCVIRFLGSNEEFFGKYFKELDALVTKFYEFNKLNTCTQELNNLFDKIFKVRDLIVPTIRALDSLAQNQIQNQPGIKTSPQKFLSELTLEDTQKVLNQIDIDFIDSRNIWGSDLQHLKTELFSTAIKFITQFSEEQYQNATSKRMSRIFTPMVNKDRKIVPLSYSEGLILSLESTINKIQINDKLYLKRSILSLQEMINLVQLKNEAQQKTLWNSQIKVATSALFKSLQFNEHTHFDLFIEYFCNHTKSDSTPSLNQFQVETSRIIAAHIFVITNILLHIKHTIVSLIANGSQSASAYSMIQSIARDSAGFELLLLDELKMEHLDKEMTEGVKRLVIKRSLEMIAALSEEHLKNAFKLINTNYLMDSVKKIFASTKH